MGAEDEPVDAQVMRRARINSDIVNLCSSRLPMWAHPSAQGIGLFTHAAGPKLVLGNPHVSYSDHVDKKVALLPLGGPKKIAPSETRPPPDKQLADLYAERQLAGTEEERIWDEMRAAAEARGEAPEDAYKMSLDTLRNKYGSINDVMPEMSLACKPKKKRRVSDSGIAMDEEARKKRKLSFTPETEDRRHSMAVMPEMGTATDATQQGHEGGTRSEYDAHRDPRLQGR